MRVKIVKAYGRPIIRPADDDAIKLARLMKQKSFTLADLRLIRDVFDRPIDVDCKVHIEHSHIKQQIEEF